MNMVNSGGSRISRWGGGGGRQPPTRTLFGKNVCQNERNGSCLDPPMVNNTIMRLFCELFSFNTVLLYWNTGNIIISEILKPVK